MIVAIISHVLSAWFAFLLPCYCTWKALSHRPVSEAGLEKWTMYWSVVGAFVAFEYVAEWIVSWLPLYWEAKTIFLLFLALPQTQGSTWIYMTYLQPFFAGHEAEIDAGIAAAQSNTIEFIQTRLIALWEALWRIATQASPAKAQTQQSSSTPAAVSAPNPIVLATGLWNAYAPTFAKSMAPVAAGPAVSTNSFQPSVSPSSIPEEPPSSHSAVPPPFPQPQFH